MSRLSTFERHFKREDVLLVTLSTLGNAAWHALWDCQSSQGLIGLDCRRPALFSVLWTYHSWARLSGLCYRCLKVSHGIFSFSLWTSFSSFYMRSFIFLTKRPLPLKTWNLPKIHAVTVFCFCLCVWFYLGLVHLPDCYCCASWR